MQLVDIDISYLDKICEIEQAVHQCPWSRGLIEAEFSKDISYRVGVVKENKLIAYSFNYLIDTEMHILNIAVDKCEQKKGVGKFLLESLIMRALTRGIKQIDLEVRKTNLPAQNLYLKAGFEIVGIRKSYYRDTGEDALLLSHNLSSNHIFLHHI